MRRKTALVSLIIGTVLCATGFFLTFLWTIDAPLEHGSHVVKAGDTFELSWYLEKGDSTEGGFTVSGGNRQANLTIKNPSGVIICRWFAKYGRYEDGFTAQDTGMYTMIFQNLDTVNDQSIDVHFCSPYEPRITFYDRVGVLTMSMGAVMLLFVIDVWKRWMFGVLLLWVFAWISGWLWIFALFFVFYVWFFWVSTNIALLLAALIGLGISYLMLMSKRNWRTILVTWSFVLFFPIYFSVFYDYSSLMVITRELGAFYVGFQLAFACGLWLIGYIWLREKRMLSETTGSALSEGLP